MHYLLQRKIAFSAPELVFPVSKIKVKKPVIHTFSIQKTME